jgi:sodium-dependent dicarboxylate transporter 2/3/5
MTKSKKDTLWMLISLAAGFAVSRIPAQAPLTQEGMCVLGIFLSSLMMWITISISWPSLITLLLLGFLPHLGFPAVFKGAFGNVTVAFLLFTFVLVYPLSKTNFVRRCTVAFITNNIARRGPWYFVAFLLFSVTFMGLFISPSVLFVAFMPFLEDIYKVLEIEKGSPTGNMLMLGTAFCISLSSGMTAIGHVWPTLAIGYYKAATGVDVNQFQYMAVGIPTGILLVLLLLVVFKWVYRPSDIHEMDLKKAMALRDMVPKTTRKEVIVLSVLALTVLLWVGPSLVKGIAPGFYKVVSKWTTAMPPLLGCILFFVLKDDGKPILNFQEVVSKGILWAAILMTGSATMLGSALTNNTMGIKAWLSAMLGPVAAGLSVQGVILFFFTWCILETNFSSNIVTTTVVTAVALSVLQALPAGTVAIGAVICLIGFGAAICNMTPAGQSTINTVAISSGWTTARDMFVWGGVFSLLALGVMTFVGYPLAAVIIG